MSTAAIEPRPQPLPLLNRGMSILELALMREAVMAIIDDGRKLPDGKRGPWIFYPPGSSDWRMDESGDCNEQRLDFCEAVSDYIYKRIKSDMEEAGMNHGK